MRADGEVMEEVRESHRGMVDGCRWNGGGMGYKVASEITQADDNRDRDSAWQS